MLDNSISVMRMFYILALLLVAALLFYFAAKASRRRPSQSGDDEQLGYQVAKDDECAVPDGATATNFQLLSIFPNVTFGIQGFVIAPLLNILSFLLGNFLTHRLLTRFTHALIQHKTPHAFIAHAHGAPEFRNWTALLSLAVFTGVVCFEIVYLSRVSRAVLGGSDASYYVFVAMLTISFMLIAIVGGQSASLGADRWLLVIGYVGLHLAIGYLASFSSPALDLTTILVVVGLAIMLYLRYKQLTATDRNGWTRQLFILLSTFGLFVSLIYFKVANANFTHAAIANALSIFTPDHNAISAKGLMLVAAASFCAAIFYNFVDFSFWQKYLAEHRQDESHETLAKRIGKPFWLYVIESPLTWLLPVALGAYAFGVVTNSEDLNPINTVLDFLVGTGFAGGLVAVAFYAALVAIASSTICGYFASTGYLLRTDFNILKHRTESRLAPGSKHLAIIGVVMILVLVPLDMYMESTDQLIALMLACFAPLCALTPFVMWPLMFGDVSLSKLGMFWISLALLAGSVVGLGLGVAAAATNADFHSLLFWSPLPSSFVLSWLLYIVAIQFRAAPHVVGE